jgi:hypothetical protein
MRHRLLASIGVSTALAWSGLIEAHLDAQGGTSKPWSAPRLADGRPDLQGVWSFAINLPFQRPASGDKEVLTDQEQAERQARTPGQDEGRKRGTAGDLNRAYNEFWYDWGTRAGGERQESVVVDPPDGRIPPLTADGQARADARAAARKQKGPSDDPEDRNLAERCLIGFNAGPPFAPSAYNNNIQIVQTRDHVVIVNEMVHDARIVPIDGRAHLPGKVRRWQGDSRGRWEGETLVVETTNFSGKNLPRGASEKVRLTERFRRTSPDTLAYEFTLDDAATWTRPWTGRVPLTRIDEPVYEYACHEANYGLEGILKGTRIEEQDKAR